MGGWGAYRRGNGSVRGATRGPVSGATPSDFWVTFASAPDFLATTGDLLEELALGERLWGMEIGDCIGGGGAALVSVSVSWTLVLDEQLLDAEEASSPWDSSEDEFERKIILLGPSKSRSGFGMWVSMAG